MVRVTIKGEKYELLGLDFDFADCEVAGKFMEVAMNAAVGKVTFDVSKVEKPTGEPHEKSRFVNPEELTEVPSEELVNADELF